MNRYKPSLFILLTLLVLASVHAQDKKALPSDPKKLANLLFSDSEFNDFLISPKGTSLALSSNEADKKRVLIMDLASKKAFSMTLPRSEYMLWMRWVDDDSLVVASGKWGIYFASLYTINTTTDKFLQIIDKYAVRMMHTLPSVEDTALVYASQQAHKPHVYKLNISASYSTRLTENVRNPGNVNGWMSDDLGTVRLGIVDNGLDRNTEIIYRKSNSDRWENILLPELTDPFVFLGDGTKMIVSSSFEKPSYGLYVYDFEEEAITTELLSLDDYSLEASSVSIIRGSATGNLVGFKVQKQKPMYVYLIPFYKDMQILLSKSFPDCTIDIIGHTPDLREVYFYVESDRLPGSLYILDQETFEIAKIVDRYHRLENYNFARTDPILFPARDGTNIHGYLTMPSNRIYEKPPLITIVHGGPWARDTWGYDPAVQYYAAMGFAVLQVNYRGSYGYPNSYSNVSFSKVLEYGITDVADGCRWVISKGIVDEKKIVIYGSSFGGYAALAGAAFEPDLYACAIGFAGVYDWKKQKKIDDANLSLSRWLKDSYDQAGDSMQLYSPANHADKITIPVLLLHGKNDSRVEIQQSRIMQKALKKAGVYCEFDSYGWVGHGFANERARIKFYERIAKFMKDHLGQ